MASPFREIVEADLIMIVSMMLYLWALHILGSTNCLQKYNLIFALIVGINHHNQNMIFGCAFLSYGIIESLEWISVRLRQIYLKFCFLIYLTAYINSTYPRVLSQTWVALNLTLTFINHFTYV